MTKRGSYLGKNPLEAAMKSSMSNACEISSKVQIALNSQSSTDPLIAAEATYLNPINKTLQIAGIGYTASFDSRGGATQTLEEFEKGTPAEVKVWWRMLTDVYPEGTPQYKTLWGKGNTYFYGHSRTENLKRMNALVTNIDSDASLAALETEVQNYINSYQDLINTQTGDKTDLKTDTGSFNTSVDDSSTALFIVYCGLVRIFKGDMTQVLAFFPMELIYLASKMREYRKLIPKSSRRKICSRKWKIGDKIKLVNNLSITLYIGLASGIDGEVATWYALAGGVTVEVTPTQLGDTSLKAVIVQNNDIAEQGDITVTIFEA